jgi:hypothetical protein
MPTRACPKCGSAVPMSDEGWAKSAISLLVPAPAIPDMATQVRCQNCGHLFAEGDVLYQDAGLVRAWRGVALLGCAFLVTWVLYKLL